MKKLKQKKGLTLVEMMAAIVVLVFLVVGIDTAMNSALRVYSESTFQSESSTLAGIMNTSLSDILRFSTFFTPETIDDQIYAEGSQFKDFHGQLFPASKLNFVFTPNRNYIKGKDFSADREYFIKYAYFDLSEPDENGRRTVQIRTLKDSESVEFVNMGAYPDLTIQDFSCLLVDQCFEIHYTISSASNDQMTHDFVYYVQPLNA